VSDIVKGDVWINKRRQTVVITGLTKNMVHYQYVKSRTRCYRTINHFKSQFQPEGA
jgi:hypothetical protein